ncbi:hypothetical protein RIF29_25281 [Crotalaria pallida]|uniref:Uncharacterized protein n=1 Tax=Crotalaria pallida TaxID=3830 RepID=A0AAN9ETH2_CROPI
MSPSPYTMINHCWNIEHEDDMRNVVCTPHHWPEGELKLTAGWSKCVEQMDVDVDNMLVKCRIIRINVFRLVEYGEAPCDGLDPWPRSQDIGLTLTEIIPRNL